MAHLFCCCCHCCDGKDPNYQDAKFFQRSDRTMMMSLNNQMMDSLVGTFSLSPFDIDEYDSWLFGFVLLW